jgi:hypothetical protein
MRFDSIIDHELNLRRDPTFVNLQSCCPVFDKRKRTPTVLVAAALVYNMIKSVTPQDPWLRL